MSILNHIKDNKITRAINRAVLYSRYMRSRDDEFLAKAIRAEDVVRVIYLLNGLTAWKSETLYNAMKRHPRFDPIIVITPGLDDKDRAALLQYVKEKRYYYIELGFDDTEKWSSLYADIIIYQKPYSYFVDRGCFAYWRNPEALPCYVPYAFNTALVGWSLDSPLFRDAWKIFFENDMSAAEASKIMRNGGSNLCVTGMPMQDQLMTPAESLPDPWKQLPHPAKRIIYAPHHSIENKGGLHFSTFMTLGEPMLRIAKRYADSVQFAFKPHPLLRSKLESKWGKERTDAYYNEWETLSNCQFENGKYDGLFAHSDAMIHDCSSFTIEYLYTRHPALYLVKETRDNEIPDCFRFYQTAFDMHYKASSEAEIERFVEEVVIGGKDTMRKEREEFYASNLVPPGGHTACENIIESILNEKEGYRYNVD